MWHLRMLSQMIPRTILFLLIGRSTFSKTDKSNPEALFQVTKDTFRTWPDDSDYNGHMNNAFSLFKFCVNGRSYQKICDIKRTAHTHIVAPFGAWKVLKSEYLIGHSATSARFLRQLPILGKYYVYTRFLTWSPDGQYLYYQTVFTRKGSLKNRKAEDKVFKEIPSIIPDDEIICAILYVRNQLFRRDGTRVTMEEVFADEGYNPHDERVQRIKEAGWEYVKNLHDAWDKETTLAGLRRTSARL